MAQSPHEGPMEMYVPTGYGIVNCLYVGIVIIQTHDEQKSEGEQPDLGSYLHSRSLNIHQTK